MLTQSKQMLYLINTFSLEYPRSETYTSTMLFLLRFLCGRLCRSGILIHRRSFSCIE